MNTNDALDIRTSLTRLAAPSLGLLVFGAMILRGLLAGNPAQTVLTRALCGLAAGVVLGSLAGSIALQIIRDRRDLQSPASDATESGGNGVAAKVAVAD